MLYYADEVRNIEEIRLADAELKEHEVRLAEQLVQQQATDQWQPEQYHDTYRERVMELIQNKTAGLAPLSHGEEEDGHGKILDLIAALKKSVAQPAARPAVESGRRRVSRIKPARRQRKAS